MCNSAFKLARKLAYKYRHIQLWKQISRPIQQAVAKFLWMFHLVAYIQNVNKMYALEKYSKN